MIEFISAVFSVLIGFLILFGPILFIGALILTYTFFYCDRHEWEYRNPYDRTCKRCGRHECEEAWTTMCTDGRVHTLNRWEEYTPAAHSPELCLPRWGKRETEPSQI